MTPLSSAQTRQLKGLAQKLDATLKVGKLGVTDAFLRSVVDALAHRELIKIRFDEWKDQKEALAEEIATKTSSYWVTRVGHVAVFYRPHDQPERRRIVLVGPARSVGAPSVDSENAAE